MNYEASCFRCRYLQAKHLTKVDARNDAVSEFSYMGCVVCRLDVVLTFKLTSRVWKENCF